MAIFLYQKSNGYPPVIRGIQLTVLLLAIGAAFWSDLFSSGSTAFSPSFLLLSPNPSFMTCLQVLTAPFLFFCQGISLNLFFDLIVLNALLTPIFTFVYSFIGKKNFVALLTILITIGSASFFFFAPLWLTPPCSLFSSLALSIVIFWAMLHSKGQSFFLMAFPISPLVYVFLATVATLYPIFLEAEWAKLIATGFMTLISYLVAIIGFHLRSSIYFFNYFEEALDKFVMRIYKF